MLKEAAYFPHGWTRFAQQHLITNFGSRWGCSLLLPQIKKIKIARRLSISTVSAPGCRAGHFWCISLVQIYCDNTPLAEVLMKRNEKIVNVEWEQLDWFTGRQLAYPNDAFSSWQGEMTYDTDSAAVFSASIPWTFLQLPRPTQVGRESALCSKTSSPTSINQ